MSSFKFTDVLSWKKIYASSIIPIICKEGEKYRTKGVGIRRNRIFFQSRKIFYSDISRRCGGMFHNKSLAWGSSEGFWLETSIRIAEVRKLSFQNAIFKSKLNSRQLIKISDR